MISAIILAAGQSRRMGEPKLLLPWGEITVLEHVLQVFSSAGLEDILVVTGGGPSRLEEVVARCASRLPVRSVYNPAHAQGEMLSSIQCGLRTLAAGSGRAALIGLGDQPQAEPSTVRSLCDEYRRTGQPLIVPSYEMRRGHPWLIARSLWPSVLELGPQQTPRDFMQAHRQDVHYLVVPSPTILADLDTPEDYRQARQPENH